MTDQRCHMINEGQQNSTYYVICMSHKGEDCHHYEDIRFITQSLNRADAVFDILEEHWRIAVGYLCGPSELHMMTLVLVSESIEMWYNTLPATKSHHKVSKIPLNTYFHEGLVNYREGVHDCIPLSDTISAVLGDRERTPPHTSTTQ